MVSLKNRYAEEQAPGSLVHSKAVCAGEPHLQDSNLCARCAQTPWADFAKEKLHNHESSVQIPESHEELRNSVCRLCQLLSLLKDPASDDGETLCSIESVDPMFITVLKFSSGISRTLGLGISLLDPDKNDLVSQRHPQNFVDFDPFKKGIQVCSEKHIDLCAPKLQQTSSSLENFRVIDCVLKSVIVAPVPCKYVCLSYCWGTVSSLSNRSSNPTHLGNLPRTIEDSMAATISLGMRYLWVDRYCIDQDDAIDKHTQIRQMGNIFSGAQVTLIAAAGEDPNYGLPGVRDRSGYCCDMGQSVTVGPVTLVTCPVPPAAAIRTSKWATRAWTYQEGYLSKKRLIFTDQRVVLICNETIMVETVQGLTFGSLKLLEDLIPRPPGIRRIPGKFGGVFLEEIHRYMVEYSKRHLSYDSDALDAISGILDALEKETVFHFALFHIWGVPMVFKRYHQSPLLSIGLTWFHIKSCQRRKDMPSWSCLGWKGPISVKFLTDLVLDSIATRSITVRGYRTLRDYVRKKPTGASSSHSANSKHLEVEGLVFDLNIIDVDWTEEEMARFPSFTRGFHVTFDHSEDAVAFIPVYWDKERIDASGYQGLVLSRTESAVTVVILEQKEDGDYERIGIFQYPFFSRTGTKGVGYRDKSGKLLEAYPDDSSPRHPYWLRNANKKNLTIV